MSTHSFVNELASSKSKKMHGASGTHSGNNLEKKI